MIDDSPIHEEVETQSRPKLSPNELMEKMATSAYELESNNRFIQANYKYYRRRTEKARILILAKRIDLIQNEQLRAHLNTCFEDPKFKPTKEDLQGFVYVECLDIAEPYEKAETAAKQAEKEFDNWSRQLSWYQSLLRKETAEMNNNLQ